MQGAECLETYLDRLAHDGRLVAAAAETVAVLVIAARRIADLVASGPLAGKLAAIRQEDIRGDSQKELDIRAHDLVIELLRAAPVAEVASEEMETAVTLDPRAPLAVAIDPLDGSSNIDTNAPIGTIFSILPAGGLLQPGHTQIAAGFFVYGPQTALVLTFGDGTRLFTLDRLSGQFVGTSDRVAVPELTAEYAINGSNHHHWDEPIRHYIDDCLAASYNTRWIASMVAEAYRILVRGGIYLYPADARKGYQRGRLRLVYEANPIAFIMEQAGASATEGRTRILNLQPQSLHERVPLVFGSRAAVDSVRQHYAFPAVQGRRAPLFGRRTLFRA